MEIITAEDLMVPIEEYATVGENATMYEAVKTLRKVQEELNRNQSPYLHRAILVLNVDRRVLGKISQLDILMALEPKYKNIGELKSISRAGFSSDFIKSIMDTYSLCERSLTEMCGNAADLKVTEFMYNLSEGEYVEADATLCEAIHTFIMGHHQSLLVTQDKRIIGILRLTDVFHKISQILETLDSA